MAEELQIVGKRAPNLDAYDRVTGGSKYTGDIELPGMLMARVLRSPHPHARIVSIDTSKAQALRGVKSVVTYKDSPKVPVYRQYILNDRVRFRGEAVAAVAAVNAETADKALKLIAVEYEVLPFVLDPEEAMKPTAPKLFPDGNIEGEPRIFIRGDVEKGLAESDQVFEREYRCPMGWGGSLEPRANVAFWERDHLTIWAAGQSPHRVQGTLAAMFNVPESKVRVISTYVGAGFGTKSAAHLDEGLTALLARKAGLPVKLQFTREEEILDSNIRYETKMKFRVGVKRDMTLHALHLYFVGNLGAYHTLWGNLGTQATHLYRIPNLKTEEYRVHTNIPNAGPVRGIGDPYENFGLESIIDEVVHEMGWDPLAFRLKNVMRTGDLVRRTASAPKEDVRLANHGMDRCIEEGAKQIAWGRRNATPGVGQMGPKARGIGMALTERDGGAGPGGAIVKVNQDGSVVVFFGTTDIGTGSRTTVPMVAAEVLGVPMEKVQVVCGDTETTPFDPGSYGNRVIHVSGKAAELAARDCLRQIFETTAPMLQAKPEELEIREGNVMVKGQPDKKVPLAQVLRRHGRAVVGQASVNQHLTSATVDRSPSAHFAEVEVDKETGKIRVLRYVAMHDAGVPINRTVVDNQIEGGVIQGFGMALSEQLHFDYQKGWCLGANFLELKPPTMLDVDANIIEALLIENQAEHGPFGAKGVGETTCHCAMAVVANAIFNATGIRLRELPFTRTAVMRALGMKV